MDREPQKFEDALERTSQNARAIGDQNLKFVSENARAIGDQVADINAEHDVAGLCRELPDRVAKLDELEGGRLAK